MEAEISRAARESTPLGAVVFDIDHFKRVNDERGLRVSAGVASAAAPIDDQLLLAEADQGLYVAKRSGRNMTVTNPRADDAGAVAANA
jgi:PleD family two-component response regulator